MLIVRLIHRLQLRSVIRRSCSINMPYGDTMSTCAQLFRLAVIAAPQSIPIYTARSDDPLDDKRVFHLLEASKKGCDLNKRADALMWVHSRIHLYLQKGGLLSKKQNTRSNDMPDMIQFKLNADELAGFDAWIAQKNFNFDNRVANSLIDNNKHGVSWDAYNDCFIASMTAKGDTNKNVGSCLLSRSTTWQEAIALNLYKAEVVYSNGIWLPRKDDTQRG